MGRNGADTDDNSAAEGARRTIFLDWRERRGSRGLVNGGLRTPTFGVIMNFWFVVGMERSSCMRCARSVTVDVDTKSNE